ERNERGESAVAAGGLVDLRRVPVRCHRLLPHDAPSQAPQERERPLFFLLQVDRLFSLQGQPCRSDMEKSRLFHDGN
ncbi:unnamed protein product, partial [Musa textilis]